MRRSNRRKRAVRAALGLPNTDPDLVLNVQADGGLLIHALTDSHVERLGPFDTAAEAWAAIDEIDSM